MTINRQGLIFVFLKDVIKTLSIATFLLFWSVGSWEPWLQKSQDCCYSDKSWYTSR